MGAPTLSIPLSNCERYHLEDATQGCQVQWKRGIGINTCESKAKPIGAGRDKPQALRYVP